MSAEPVEIPVDYEKLFEEIKAKPCRVDRIDRAYEAHGRKPLRTSSHVIDRELEVMREESRASRKVDD